MTTDLKTLKDLEPVWTGDEDGYEWIEDSENNMISLGDIEKLRCVSDLRAEAIKWIHALNTLESYCMHCQSRKCFADWEDIEHKKIRFTFDSQDHLKIIGFIKIFFNISDADLED